MTTPIIYLLIICSGLLQAFGPPMNGQLRLGLVNPWLASLVSFGLIVVAFAFVCPLVPLPGPTAASLEKMPWWAPLGGITGAFAVVAGLIYVEKIGAGPLAALTIGANLVASVAIDHFGLMRMQQHPVTALKAGGVAVLIAGMLMITKG